MSAEQRAAVIANARSWIGTPYHHMARIKGVGVDCATILCEVYEAAGVVPHVDPGVYPADWHLHRDEERYIGWMLKFGHEVETPQPGDVAVWKFGRCFSHGAIVCDNGNIVHAYINQGVRLDRMDNPVFSGRAVRYFSLWNDG